MVTDTKTHREETVYRFIVSYYMTTERLPTMRQIQKYTGVCLSYVLQAVKDLVKKELVQIDKVGRLTACMGTKKVVLRRGIF